MIRIWAIRPSVSFRIGLVVVSACLVLLLAWQLGVSQVYRPFEHLPGIDPWTIVLSMNVAVMLCLHSQLVHRQQVSFFVAARFLACLGILFCGLFFAEYLLDRPIPGFDVFWLADVVREQNPVLPGRPSPQSVSSLLFLFVAYLFLRPNPTRRRFLVVQSVAFAGLFMPALAILGYVFYVTAFFELRSNTATGMSVLAAGIFWMLGLGTLALFPARGVFYLLSSKSAGGFATRRLIPAVIFIPLILGWSLFYFTQKGGWTEQMGLALYVLVVASIFVLLTLRIGHILTQKDEMQKAAAAQREELYRKLAISVDQITKLKTQVVTMCAWTHRIKDQDRWINLEEFLTKYFDIPVTHGISDEAFNSAVKELKERVHQSSPNGTVSHRAAQKAARVESRQAH